MIPVYQNIILEIQTLLVKDVITRMRTVNYVVLILQIKFSAMSVKRIEIWIIIVVDVFQVFTYIVYMTAQDVTVKRVTVQSALMTMIFLDATVVQNPI